MRTLPVHLDNGFRNRTNARVSGLQASKKALGGGMACPECGGKTCTIDSRPVADGTYRRRRVCVSCKFRFTTYELYRPDVPVWVPDFQI